MIAAEPAASAASVATSVTATTSAAAVVAAIDDAEHNAAVDGCRERMKLSRKAIEDAVKQLQAVKASEDQRLQLSLDSAAASTDAAVAEAEQLRVELARSNDALTDGKRAWASALHTVQALTA